MMTFYAAAGSYQIRSEDGKNMPYIMRLGKLQPVSIPEFSLWSMLLWDVLTYEELRKKFYDKMEETEIETSVYKGYKQDKIEMRGDRAEMSDFPLYLNTVAGGLDRRDQTIGGFSFVVKIYAVPVVEIIG